LNIMIYWLIIFSFDVNGNFLSKQELQLSSKSMCEMVAAQYPAHLPQVRTGPIKTVCVSDDHHSGRKPDVDVPLD
jgi:hypothetical protein